jgi:hypothetical protein
MDLVSGGGGVRYCKFEGDPIVVSTGEELYAAAWWQLAY